jgi:hypothetical protein
VPFKLYAKLLHHALADARQRGFARSELTYPRPFMATQTFPGQHHKPASANNGLRLRGGKPFDHKMR